MRKKPQMLIIAGPNGSGKSTFAFSALSEFLDINEFVNADEIAKGISPLNPESANIQAGKVMITRVNSLIKSQKSFAIETTLSGKLHLKFIKEAKSQGFRISLIFLRLSKAEQAIFRVKNRVAHGGHNIPEETIRRRFERGFSNLFDYYIDHLDDCRIIDNYKSTYR